MRTASGPLHAAVFLDRDGVIIENRADYVRSLAEVQFIPGALEALADLARRDWQIVVVTNQSAIGRGLLTPETAQAINTHIVEKIASAGGRVDGVYVCPHAPGEACACRKPAPGLLLDAARDLGIDLSASVMIGDALTDVLAAQAAGAAAILVRTGRGETQAPELARADLHHIRVVPDLSAAIEQLDTFKSQSASAASPPAG